MITLQRVLSSAAKLTTTELSCRLNSAIGNPLLHSPTLSKPISTKAPKGGGDEWNDAWETAWLPEDLKPSVRAPWETDVNFPSGESAAVLSSDVDADTKAFVEDMNDNWDTRRTMTKNKQQPEKQKNGIDNGRLYSLDNIKKDYRLKKQRIHAGLWVKEIERMEEAKFESGGDDIERLLDSCSEIFDTSNDDMDKAKVPSTSEFKNKPDGWETTSKTQDGNVWDMSQREEDILLQEFDRRIAYSKFQIASFIKTHIFSRRRPIDGWKYMIEEIGPNARKGKGSVSRLPALSDPATQPFREDRSPSDTNLTPLRRR